MQPGGEVGAVVVGGEHPGLGIARSLGRRDIAVYVIDDQRSVCSFSKYAMRFLKVKDLRDERRAVDAVLDAGRRFGLKDWVLFPTRDETVAAFSRHREELATIFRVPIPDWNSVKWAWDKKNTYELATKLRIPCPQTFYPRNSDDLKELHSKLPLAVKPAVKENFFYATGAKAWRADTAEQLERLYAKAARKVNPDEILVQQIIPGDGRYQLSYCAFFRGGVAHSTLVARRRRQHPYEFGRAATYVESIELPAVEELAERFLKAIDYYGLVEVEFKEDPRDGEYKLLDVNARTWGFHTLGFPAGVDFPYLLFADQMGEVPKPCRGRAGATWIRLVTDIPTGVLDIFKGRQNCRAYLRSLCEFDIESVFTREDPLPAIAELLLLPYLCVTKGF